MNILDYIIETFTIIAEKYNLQLLVLSTDNGHIKLMLGYTTFSLTFSKNISKNFLEIILENNNPLHTPTTALLRGGDGFYMYGSFTQVIKSLEVHFRNGKHNLFVPY